MLALAARIRVLSSKQNKNVDGRNRSGQDEGVLPSKHIMS